MTVFHADAVFLFRRDRKENWEAENPVLRPGEIGVVMNPGDRDILKIGDGKTAWHDLEWVYLLHPDDLNAVLDAAAHTRQYSAAAAESFAAAQRAAGNASDAAAEAAEWAEAAEDAASRAESAAAEVKAAVDMLRTELDGRCLRGATPSA